MTNQIEPDALAGQLRQARINGLQEELAFLQSQRTPNSQRIAAVKAELDTFSDKPARRVRETRKD